MTEGWVLVILLFLLALLVVIGIFCNVSNSRDEERRHPGARFVLGGEARERTRGLLPPALWAGPLGGTTAHGESEGFVGNLECHANDEAAGAPPPGKARRLETSCGRAIPASCAWVF